MTNDTTRRTVAYGPILAEGKTKAVLENTNRLGLEVILHSKDDITGGNGKLHAVIPGKGAVSNKTTCNVFRFLRSKGVPVAYIDRLGEETDMLAEQCEMIPLEVVARRKAQGSILKRRPELAELTTFVEPVYELFLKTSNLRWKGHILLCDDPFIQERGAWFDLYLPDKPMQDQTPFLRIPKPDVFGEDVDAEPILQQMKEITLKTFLLLEAEYKYGGNFDLVDFKVEFGFMRNRRLGLGDVIDAESVRLRRDNKNFDKQPFRNGEILNPELMERFGEVLKATERFRFED
jgi:phosphoribosylaminoimidazole-succinocarboxamide synthase